MLGLAALGRDARPAVRRATALCAAGEMIGDLMPNVPDRIAPMPLAGRAIAGAIVGSTVASRSDENRAALAVLGAGSAIASAFATYHVRKRIHDSARWPNAVLGLAEDAVMLATASYALRAMRAADERPR
jgi:uncharacterized membrane protein